MDLLDNTSQMLPCAEERLFPLNLACWVYINYIDDDGLWVMLASEEPIINAISDALNNTDGGERVQSPSVNDAVSALNTDNVWYRGIIEAVEPEIKIRFIDFGDTLVVSQDNLAPLPPPLINQRRLAMKIQLSPDSLLQPVVGSKIFVRSFCSRMGSVVVDVIQPEEETETHDFCPNKISTGSTHESTNGALTGSASELSMHLIELSTEDKESIESNSLSVLDVPPPTGFSSDISELELKENDIQVHEGSSEDVTGTSYSDDSAIHAGVPEVVEPSVVSSLILLESSGDIVSQESSSNDSTIHAEVSEVVEPSVVPSPILESSGDNVSQKPSSHDSTIHAGVPDVVVEPSVVPSLILLDSSDDNVSQKEVNEAVSSSLEQLSCTSDGGRVLDKITQGLNEPLTSESTPDSSSLEQSSCTSDEDKVLDNINQVLNEPLPSKATIDCVEDQDSPTGNLEHVESSTFPVAKMSHQVAAVMSDVISTSTNDKENTMRVEESQSTYSNVSEPMDQSATRAFTNRGDTCVGDRSENEAKFSVNPSLEQYPNIGGGGYPAHRAAAELKLNCKQGSSTPRIITKGRNNEASHLVCQQGSQSSPFSHSSAESNVETSKVSYPESYGHSASQEDFKTVLEFELSIIREQHRLQILQLQKKMDQNMKNQINAFKAEVSKELATLQNEVMSRLSVVNDSVVRKIADVYSDITMLKNDHAMNTHNRPRAGCEAVPSKRQDLSQGMRDFVRVAPSGEQDSRESRQHCMKEFRNSGNSPGNVDIRNSNFPVHFQNQHQGQFSNEFSKKDSHTMDDMKRPPNHLMEMRKEKMRDVRNGRDYNHSQNRNETSRGSERSSNQNYHRESSIYQSLDKHLDEQHSNFPVGQFNPNCLKMDHLDQSESRPETNVDTGSSKSGSIISVSNLSAEKINTELLFNLFGVYGNIQRIKISQQEKGKAKAFIEMENSSQADEAIRYLHRAPLMGQRLYVTPCNFGKLMISRQDFEANTAKDFTRHQMVLRFPNRFKSFKWDPQKLFAPSPRLMITNVLKSVSDEKVKEVFAKSGFQIQHISSSLVCANDEKKIVFATLGSIEEAMNALTVMHLQETSDWSKMRISFARNDKAAF